MTWIPIGEMMTSPDASKMVSLIKFYLLMEQLICSHKTVWQKSREIVWFIKAKRKSNHVNIVPSISMMYLCSIVAFWLETLMIIKVESHPCHPIIWTCSSLGWISFFENCEFLNCKFLNCKFLNCTFLNCDLVNCFGPGCQALL